MDEQEKRSLPTSIRLSPELKAFLKQQADKHKRPLAYQIIWILNQYRELIEEDFKKKLLKEGS